MFWRMILVAISLATAAPAQDAARINAIFDAWQGWATYRGIDNTAIAIGYNGRIAKLGGIGRSPQDPYPLASLSKAITATCLHDILRRQNNRTDQTLGALTPAFARAGVTIPAAAAAIRIADVITMTSGLSPDTTQGSFLFNRFKDGPDNARFANYALRKNAMRGNVGEYYYNNSNYALLGALIDGLTGTDNVSACRDRVFPAAHRTTVGFNPEWIAFAGFGGWQASASDYLGFVMAQFGPRTQLAESPRDAPHAQIEGAAHYGLGTLFAQGPNGTTFWHTGALCNFGISDEGSYFAQYANGYAVVVNYDVCGRAAIWRPLDTALARAAFEPE